MHPFLLVGGAVLQPKICKFIKYRKRGFVGAFEITKELEQETPVWESVFLILNLISVLLGL